MDIKKEDLCRTASTKSSDHHALSTSAIILRHLLFLALGYLAGLAHLPFGAAPFGLALICSTRACTLSAFAGVILSSLSSSRGAAYAASYLAALAIRTFIGLILAAASKRENKSLSLQSHIFNETTAVCALCAASSAFSLSVYYFIKGGYLLYDGYSLALCTASAAVATLVWRHAILKLETEKIPGKPGSSLSLRDIQRLAGMLLLFAVAVRGADGIYSLGIYIAPMIATLLMFAAVKYRSIPLGALCGALCGLAIAPLLSPSFVFGAVAFGMLSPISIFLGVFGALVVALWWGFYVLGISALSFLFPALLAAGMLFTVLDGLLSRKDIQPAEKSSSPSQKPLEETPLRTKRTGLLISGFFLRARALSTQQALGKLGYGLNSLSDELYDLSHKNDDGSSSIYGICESAFESACSSCTEREICHADCEFSAEFGAIGGDLRRGEKAQRSSVGEKIRGRCSRLPDILDEINYNAALRRCTERDRAQTEFLALDYSILSALVSACSTDLKDEYHPDRELEKKISSALGGTAVFAFGKRRRTVVLFFESTPLPDDKIRAALYSVCRSSFSLSNSIVEDGINIVIYEQNPKISIVFDTKSTVAAGEGELCGDTCGTVETNDRSRFIAFINDGMGCGREAAEVSRAASAFIKNLLPISRGCEQTVLLLNSFLRRRGIDSLKECSVSVDIADIDLINAKAYFCKSGAAPTYVLRGNSVFKLRARTIPVGIINEIDVKQIELELYPNDIIVMVSDGVTQSKDECPRLFEILKNNQSTDPKRISDIVLRYAAESGAKDDVSVLTLRVNALSE